MFNLNRAMVIGNVTRDPELRTIPSGRSVAGFAVATNRRWTDQESGELKEEVQFHEIVAWGKLAEIASQIIHKGDRVYVEGRLRTRTWEGQDGARRERTEIIAESMIQLTPKGASQVSQSDQTGDFEENQDKRKEESTLPAGRQVQGKGSAPAAEKPAAKPDKSMKTEVKSDSDDINLDEIPF